MNATPNLERDLARWMSEVAPSRAPDHLAAAIVARTGSTRPRPRWLARLMEPPMQTHLSFGRPLGFGRAMRPLLVALILLAALAGAIYVGSQLLRQPTLPPPFGLASNGTIAVVLEGSLVLMEPDGSGMRTVDLGRGALTAPAFSRDGQQFVAWGTPDAARPKLRSIVVANADGSGPRQLVPDTYALGPVSTFAWSPDDRLVAFSDSSDRLYIVDVAAGAVAELAPRPSVSRRDPAWSPDGRLAYRCQHGDQVLNLCVTDAQRTTETILETSVGTGFAFQHSVWSHGGTRIAYYVDDVTDHPPTEPGYDIAWIDVITGEERILTDGHDQHMILPTWSPDDRYIVALGAIIAADGSGVTLMNDGNCDWSEPSPDGRWAACLNEGVLRLYPIEGGPPNAIQLQGAGSGYVTWQRLGLGD